jgi:hypothetical protein
MARERSARERAAKEKATKQRSGGSKAKEPADLYAAYLALRPESDPRILVPRSALPLARGAFLMHGVLVQGWSVAWLVGFLFAELFLVIRLAVVGDRLSGGPQLDPELHRKRSFGFQLVWLAVSLATVVYAGQGLDRSTRGAWFGLEDPADLVHRPSWGVLVYLILLLGEFAFDLAAARRERRTFASAGTLQATLFIVAAVLLAFVGIVLVGLAHEGFGDSGARGMFAFLLVLARTGSELGVLWFPLWGPGRLVAAGDVPAASLKEPSSGESPGAV